MQCNRPSIVFMATLAICTAAVLVTSTRAVAQREKLLYSFGTTRTDGTYPLAGLTFDTAGNLYGTTDGGGTDGFGTVFELTRKGGGWTETILYNFRSGADGAYPAASLIIDASGNLYGTTYGGGTAASGTVFQLMPKSGGGWTEKVLHSFGHGKDGGYLYAGLILDVAGNLYGTTYEGGAGSLGTVFELTPKAGGGWTENVLHSFGHGKDGASPRASLILDTAGNLYGTTFYGGADGLGTVFELMPEASGKWAEKVLHSFNGEDGKYPSASVIFDASGNLCGATENSIFELMPKTGGGWTEKVLYNSGSTASLIFDGAGKLYGTSVYGGPYDYGTVFELASRANGTWTYTTLYSFMGTVFGAYPSAGVILSASGNMYGTTYQGGDNDQGTIFEFTP